MEKINWYPGHMAKTRRLIQEKISVIDIIFEVVDARIPFSSKIIDIDTLTRDKPKILVMTKKDLCDISETEKWIKYYEEKGYNVVLLDLEKNVNLKPLYQKVKEVMAILNEKRKAKGLMPRKARVLVMGIPNVGKSTLINRLAGKKATKVGNTPGLTKSLDWIRINNDIELLDSPGILWPNIEDEKVGYNLASLTAIKEEILPLERISNYIMEMLIKYYPNIVEERYKTNETDIEKLYLHIGKIRGCLVKGGEVDIEKVHNVIISDVKNGIIKNITFDRYENE